MKYKNIIWDLDGTLLDTLEDLADATNYALRTNGMKERTLDEVRQFAGNGVRNLIIRAVPDGEDNALFEKVFTTFKEYYIIHCQDKTTLYPGIKETLECLKQRGLKMAIVSNKLQKGVSELYEIWFKETIDIAVGERENIRRKPERDMVDIAMRELEAKAEDTVYIGDSDVDIATARNAGLDCISVLWGFRDYDFLIAHGATLFAKAPADIVDLLT